MKMLMVINQNFACDVDTERMGMIYRCYFKGLDSADVGWRSFEQIGDNEAIEHAMGLFALYANACSLEIWDGSRIAGHYKLPDVPTPDILRMLSYRTMAAVEAATDINIKRLLAGRAFELAQEAEVLERVQAGGCSKAKSAPSFHQRRSD